MSEITIEVRFNSKSTGQGIADALKLAEKHGATFDGKICIVKFESPEDPDIEKTFNLINGKIF